MKTCSKCRAAKSVTAFYTRDQTEDGLTYKCIECTKAEGRARYVARKREKPTECSICEQRIGVTYAGTCQGCNAIMRHYSDRPDVLLALARETQRRFLEKTTHRKQV
jgi:hypothetical protein